MSDQKLQTAIFIVAMLGIIFTAIGCSTGGGPAGNPRADVEDIVAEPYPASLFVPEITNGGTE